MLILEARELVDLGMHALPGRIPWRNLQVLLRKRGKEDAGALAAVLAQKPFGERLADHVRQRFTQVTRDSIEAVDATYCNVFDFVSALLVDSKSGSASVSVKSGKDDKLDEHVFLAAAVGEQEREVARLRRQLREAERSEEAARKFAEANAPATCNAKGGYPEQGQKAAAAPGTSHAHVQSLQYRLNEVEVPEMQEAVLECLLLTALDPREGSRKGAARLLEVIGFSEDREEPEVAKLRAEAVQSWLLDHGVEAENLQVEFSPGGPRSNRRVDLRLQDADGAAVMKRAQEMMSKLFIGQSAALESPAAETQSQAQVAKKQVVAAAVEPAPVQEPCDSEEEGLDSLD